MTYYSKHIVYYLKCRQWNMEYYYELKKVLEKKLPGLFYRKYNYD
jgi:hypothetical protein